MKIIKNAFLFLVLVGAVLPQDLRSRTPEPVVHALLFFSPTCAHCHEVIANVLIPLQDQYGNQLMLMGLDTSQQWASNLYWEAVRHFEIPEDDWAVPMLIVGDQVLIGGIEIPGRFSTILEEGLAADGIDLPNFPALVSLLTERDALDPRFPDRLIARQALSTEETEAGGEGDSAAVADSTEAEEAPPPEEDPAAAAGSVPEPDSARTPDLVEEEGEGRGEGQNEGGLPPGTPDPSQPPPSSPTTEADLESDPAPRMSQGSAPVMGLNVAVQKLESMTMWDRFNLDPKGGTLSVLVLLGMVLSLALRGYPPRVQGEGWSEWVIPTLVVAGAGVAAYLSYIEVSHSEAVCGPVGDCNAVNQSEYATLFGLLPVGLLGLMGYGAIFLMWVVRYSNFGGLADKATLGMWGAVFFGTIFSMYLTFLEPFVIGATCIWCLSSAAIISLLLWAVSPLAAKAWPTGGRTSRTD